VAGGRQWSAGAGAALGPSPGGPLELRLRCWSSRSPGAPFVRHAARVLPDWSVEVPHDLAAERVACALGGWLSCLELEERVVPAARRWLELATRSVPPPITLLGHVAWTPTSRLRCCPSRGFESAEKAFEHVCDARHLAEQFGGDRKQVGDLVRPLGRAWRAALSIPDHEAARAAAVLARGDRDVTALWYAGVHPGQVVAIHEAVGVPGRLPARLFLGVLLRGPDPAWVGSTMRSAGVAGQREVAAGGTEGLLGSRGEEPLAEWLAWTHGRRDVADPTARGRWLALGVSRVVLLRLAECGVDPQDVAQLAAGTGRSADGAARCLLGWLALGVTPAVRDLVALHRSGRASAWSAPPARAVERVRAELGGACSGADRLELAYLLSVCGTTADTVAAHRAGRTWRDELGIDDPQTPGIERAVTLEEQESA